MEEEPLKTYTFKAGLMNFDEQSKIVSADKRKGQVTVQKFSGGETRFFWNELGQENQQQDEYEFEMYIFPSQGKIELSKQRDRVLILFNEDEPGKPEPIQFFWTQDKNIAVDAQIVTEVNKIINETLEEDEQYEDIEDESQNLLQSSQQQQNSNNNNQQQQNQQTNNNNNQDLIQQMMATMQQQYGGNQQQNNLYQQMMQQQQQKQAPYLSRLFTKEYLEEIAKEKDFQDILISELPEGQQNLENLLSNLKSPQFQQSLESLDRALNSGDGASVLMSLGIPSDGFQRSVDGNQALYEGLEQYAKDQKN